MIERLEHIDDVNFQRAEDYLKDFKPESFEQAAGDALLKFRDLNVFLASSISATINSIARRRGDKTQLAYFSYGFGMVTDMFFQKYEGIVQERLKSGVPRWQKEPVIDELIQLYSKGSSGKELDQHPAIEQVVDHLLKTVYTDEEHQRDFRIGAYIAHKSLGVLFQ